MQLVFSHRRMGGILIDWFARYLWYDALPGCGQNSCNQFLRPGFVRSVSSFILGDGRRLAHILLHSRIRR